MLFLVMTSLRFNSGDFQEDLDPVKIAQEIDDHQRWSGKFSVSAFATVSLVDLGTCPISVIFFFTLPNNNLAPRLCGWYIRRLGFTPD